MVSAHPVQSAPRAREPVTNFAEQYRSPNDYLYLPVDGQAECALGHPLSVPSLIESLGDAAVTRVLRPDIAHDPDRCPALIQLARPGDSVLPRQAGVHAFRLIRDARRLGLEDSRDVISLSLHRVFLHPDLPQHPEIQKDIAQARAGAIDLHSHFTGYSQTTWKRIVAELPRAKDYS